MAANKSHEPSSSSSRGRWRYDVFLSFRGKDTRTNFTNHLFFALKNAGINHVFRDDNDLPAGENISTELLEAIQDSRISIIVFSGDFAASSWCLEELTKIMECRKTVNQVVFPVFYKVEPSDVRKQEGSFEAAFAQHEKRFTKEKEKVLRWRHALTEAANLSGFHCTPDRLEGEFIEEIVKKILNNFDGVSCRAPLQGIGSTPIKDYENFESRISILEGIMEALRDPSINMVGIYGMGGVGKTMLVKEVARKAKKEKSLFDQVVMAVVSQTASIRNIQGEIADMLGMRFDEESESGRASRLCERLKRENRILVILDDIWAELDLEAVGIPLGDVHKGCKIVMTSRRQDVLSNQMNTQKNFKLEALLEKEAWNLFKKMAGDSIEAPDLEPTAFKVAKECAGLPIAVAVVAKALKNESLPVWEDAFHQLRSSSPTTIEGMDAKVYSSLKLSYNRLESEAKLLFLLCSLFPEDYQFSILDFLKYGKGLGLFQGMDTLEKARNRVHALVRRLKASCLLLEANTSELVKMHDVLRDVGISIASKDEHMFIVRNSIELEERTIEENLRRCPAFSVPSGDIIELPTGLECPELKVFSIFNNTNLEILQSINTNLKIFQLFDANLEIFQSFNPSTKIPDSFFEGMKQLKVLNLTEIHFSSLPSSLHFLSNLQTLCLDECALGDITIIGELTKLENLSFRSSYFKELPREIGQLTRLKMLDLSNCGLLQVIPSKVIASLSQLEELYMENSFNKWDVDGNASLAELKHLSRLATLDIHIPNVNILPKDLVFEKLTRYRIFVGYIPDIYVGKIPDSFPRKSSEFETLRTLKLSRTSIHLMFGINMLLKRTEDLLLYELNGIKSVLRELDVQGFPHLKHLRVEESSKIEYVINITERGPHSALPKLESLLLYSLTNLKEICRGQLSPNSFCNLRRVEVRNCARLKNLFSLSVARRLSQLEEISIGDCRIMDAIVAEGREGAEGNNEVMDGIIFPQLRSLTLKWLPELMSFHSKVKTVPSLNYTPTTDAGSEEIILEGEHDIPMPLFNEKVAFPSLESLTIGSGSGSMKVIWHSQTQLPVDSFRKLKYLSVYECHHLLKIIPSNVLPRLQNMESLTVSICLGSLEYIFDLGGQNDTARHELRSLSLEYLLGLMHIWKKDSPGIFPFQKLTSLYVSQCHRLRNIFTTSIPKSLVPFQELKITRCNEMEEIVEKEGVEEATMDTIVFPQVTSLILDDLPQLKSICQRIHISEWPSLKKLKVSQCENLEIFASEFSSFKEMCGKLPLFLVDKVAFPNLEEMELELMSSMKEIWQGQFHARSFRKLGVLKVKNCDEILKVVSISLLQNLQNLKLLYIKSCSSLEEVFGLEGLVGEVGHAETLPRLRELRKEKSLLSPIFQNLTTLKVTSCGRLTHLLPFTIAESLVQIKSIHVASCESMKEIIASKKGEATNKTAFNQLISLKLKGLPNLTRFCPGSNPFSFPSLEKVLVEYCPKLKTFSNNIVYTPKLVKVHLKGKERVNVDRAKEVYIEDPQWLWHGDLNTTIQHLFEQQNVQLSEED